jgi:hypothetical protein
MTQRFRSATCRINLATFAIIFAFAVASKAFARGAALAAKNQFLYFKEHKLVLIEHNQGHITHSWGVKIDASTVSLYLSSHKSETSLAMACSLNSLLVKTETDTQWRRISLARETDACQIVDSKQGPGLMIKSKNQWTYLNSQQMALWISQKVNPLPKGTEVSKEIAKSLAKQIQLWDWQDSGALANTTTGLLLLTESEAGILEMIPSRVTLPMEDYSVSARSDQILLSGSFGAKLYSVNSPENPVTLPVTPCDDNETCKGSLGEDGSWFLCGSWGCYLGFQQSHQRLNLLPSRNAFVAHVSAQNAYFISSLDDADLGMFPSQNTLVLKAAIDKNSATLTGRKIYWTRPQIDLNPSINSLQVNCLKEFGFEALFPLKQGNKNSWVIAALDPKSVIRFEASRSFERRQSICELPSFVAWENQVDFKPPTFSEGTAAETPQFKWREILKIDELWKNIHNADQMKQVLVGVVDSGVDLDHSEFKDKIVSAYDFVDEDETPQDQFGHGTHVTGILAGNSAGIAKNAKLIIARALDERGASNSVDLARAISFVALKGAKIVNCSWGGGSHTQVLKDSFTYLNQNHILAFTSAGNDNLNLDQNSIPPKDYPGVFVTGGLKTGTLQKAAFSSYGSGSVQEMNPATDIGSATLGLGYGNKSGTSMASPMSAGLAAVLMGGGAQSDQIKSLICEASETIPRYSSCGAMNPSESWAKWQKIKPSFKYQQ